MVVVVAVLAVLAVWWWWCWWCGGDWQWFYKRRDCVVQQLYSTRSAARSSSVRARSLLRRAAAFCHLPVQPRLPRPFSDRHAVLSPASAAWERP